MIIENRVLFNLYSLSRGGGISAYWECTPYISNNTIERNSATSGLGGGVFLCSGIIEKNIRPLAGTHTSTENVDLAIETIADEIVNSIASQENSK